jgi:hypothetical protein
MTYIPLLFLSKLQYIAFKIQPTTLGIHVAKCVFRSSAHDQPRIFQLCIQCNSNLEALQFDSFAHSFTPGNSLFPFLHFQILHCDMSIFPPPKIPRHYANIIFSSFGKIFPSFQKSPTLDAFISISSIFLQVNF